MQEPAGDIKPEIDILICCARRSLDASQIARLKQKLAQPVSWTLLLRLANDNGLLPLLHEHLLANFADAVPGDTAAQLRRESRQNAVRSLFLTAELLRIVKLFQRSGLPVLPYKGPVIAQLAYGNPSLRHFDDLDIVVPQKLMPQVYEDLQSLGYETKLPHERFVATDTGDIPGEYVFLHRLNGAMVEFHTEHTLRHFPRTPNLEDMAARSVSVSLNNRNVQTFANSDMLLMLCVHGAKDFWSRLIWVADVVAVAENCTEDDWTQALSQAQKYGAERMLRVGLFLAFSIFDFRPPAQVWQSVERDSIAQRLGKQLQDQLLCRNELPQKVAWRSLYRIRMVRGVYRGLCYWLRLSTTPAEEDWSATKEQSARRGSYALLRPLRLWRKYSRDAGAEKPGRKS